MARTESVKRPRRTPQGQARADAQRERILTAAKECFVQHGFHAASMASISETAGMSAGLIYRYFEGKSDIILGIIEQQLQENRATIARLQSDSEFINEINDLVGRWKQRDPDVVNPVLFLEMSAEASRDGRISEALVEADRSVTEALSAWISESARDHSRPLAKEKMQRHVFVLQCFLEGLFVRAVRQPHIDPQLLEDCLRLFLPALLSPMSARPAASGQRLKDQGNT